MEFTLKAFFTCTPQVLYDTWLDSKGHSAMTGGLAEVTPVVGDSFHAWDGYIWGETKGLEPNRYIKQSWKTSEFKEDQDFSELEIWLKPSKGGTELTLKHGKLTEADDHYIKGWEDHYFAPMHAYFAD